MAVENKWHRQGGVLGVWLAGFLIKHFFHIAVVGGYQGLAAYFIDRCQYPAHWRDTGAAVTAPIAIANWWPLA